MRHKPGTAFLQALSIQRRRAQQGFHHRADVVDAQGADILADVGEMSVLSEGPHGADVEPTHRKM